MFSLTTSGRALPDNQFHFEVDGKQYSLPKQEYLPGVALDYLDAVTTGDKKPGRIEFLLTMVELSGNKPLAAVLKKADLAVAERDALLAAWRAESKVDAGESSGSEGS